MSLKIRTAVRVILLNEADQLLLMCIENFDISTLSGQKNKRFWCTIGGAIEPGESVEQAARREIYEETGIDAHEIELGPVVWISEFELMLKGTPTHFKEQFIVARTCKNNVALHQPTQDEKDVVTQLTWFSFDDITQSPDVIFPVKLTQFLPDVIEKNYPVEPLRID